MAAYESLKAVKKSSWVKSQPKVVAVAYGSDHFIRVLFITKFKSQFKRDFTSFQVTYELYVLNQSDNKLLKLDQGGLVTCHKCKNSSCVIG